MHRATKAILLCLVLFLALPGILSRAEGGEPGGDAVGQREEILSGRVRRIAEQREFESMGHTQVYQKLELTITEGPRRGEAVIVEQGLQPTVRQDLYRVGDAVYLVEGQDASGNRSYYIVGRARWRTLAWVFFLFVVLVVLIGRGRGAMSLVGMGLSFVVIRFLILPHLSGGEMSVMTTVLGAALAMPGGYYLAHGLNWKTTIALLGSFLGLGLTGALAAAFVGAAHLSGFASEEMSLLGALRPGEIDARGLLLAGIVVGMIGVLDDITVAQASVVEQLSAANVALDWRQLYLRAMKVGQDHIASMVNTLVLVYAGASLALLLLLTDQSLPFLYVLSHEVIAEEIVRMLVMSMGLVAAVPITTFLASLAADLRRAM